MSSVKQEFIYNSFRYEPIHSREGQPFAYVEFSFEGFAYRDYDTKLVDELPPSMVVEVYTADGQVVPNDLEASLFGLPGQFRLSGDLGVLKGTQNLKIELNDIPLFKPLVVEYGDPTAPLEVDFRISSFTREVYSEYFPLEPHFPVYDVYIIELDSKTINYLPPIIIDVFGEYLPLELKSFSRIELEDGFRTAYTVVSKTPGTFEGYLKIGDAVLRERKLRLIYQSEVDRNIRDATKYFTESSIKEVTSENGIVSIYKHSNADLKALTTFTFSSPDMKEGNPLTFDIGVVDVFGDFYPIAANILIPVKEVVHEFELLTSGEIHIRIHEEKASMKIRTFSIYSPKREKQVSGMLVSKNNVEGETILMETSKVIENPTDLLLGTMAIHNNGLDDLECSIYKLVNGKDKIVLMSKLSLLPGTTEFIHNATLAPNTAIGISNIKRATSSGDKVSFFFSGKSIPEEY